MRPSAKTLFLIAALALIGASASATPIAFNYRFNTINAGVTGLDVHDFGDCTLTSPCVFVHDPSINGPAQAALGTGIVYVSGQVKLDLTIFPTVALTGDYNDLINKPTIPAAQPIQDIRVQTDSSGNYTWTYPTAYGSGVVPVISVIAEGGTTVPLNVQLVGSPTNTTATFKVLSLPSTSVLGIVVLGAPAGTQAYLHIWVKAP